MKIKKIFFAALCCFVCISSVSCGAPKIRGEELVNQAREDYKALNSAQVIMTNTDTNEIEQTFTFKYDEKDTLMFSYYGKSEKTEYAQYNNGAECFTYDNGKLTHTVKGDGGFQRYTREATHPQADKGLLIFEPSAIINTSSIENDEEKIFIYQYDINKINAEVENGEVTGFETKYCFNSDNKLKYFTETTTSNENGNTKNYSYKVEITRQNSVDSIKNTTEQFKNNS